MGRIVYDEWIKSLERYLHVLLDVFQIMPNHMHGIIGLWMTPPSPGLGVAYTLCRVNSKRPRLQQGETL